MARRAKEEAEKTRARILASALALFAKKGYDHTTMTDVAARLKMTKGAVYWHFRSKEQLLMALLDEMLERFNARVEGMLAGSGGRLTFGAVAEMMVQMAEGLIADARGKAFFLLIHEQIQWSAQSMANVRAGLLESERMGPWHAFRAAVEADAAAGRARADADAVETASVCMAIWDGLVHSRIADFLRCDLSRALRNAYAAVWAGIAAGGDSEKKATERRGAKE